MGSAPPAGLAAFVRYRSAEPQKGSLPVKVGRTLYRLVAQGTEKGAGTPPDAQRSASAVLAGEPTVFRAEPVADGDIRSNELYLEEILLEAAPGANAPRYGLLEVPLPPGADVERGTWGIRLRGLDGEETVVLERARHQPGELAYAVPVDTLAQAQRIRHLIRFGSRGEFVLPPARFQSMYQPEDKAFEALRDRRLQV